MASGATGGLKFEAEVTRTETAALVKLKGKITLGEASQALRATVEQLCGDGMPNVVLNLAEVPFIDSAGLGVLTMGYSAAKAAGGMLKVAAAQERVKDALEITRLTRLFPLYSTPEEALASFASGARGIEAQAQ